MPATLCRVPAPGSNPIAIPGYGGVNEARKLLADGQPVVLDFDLREGFGGGMEAENWIYSYAVNGTTPPIGMHSVCLAGYNDTLTTKDGKGAFLVINSWGADKFDKGYLWITYKYIALASYNNDFSTLALRDNYQPRLTATFELQDFGCFQWLLKAGLKVDNNVYSQPLWTYRWGQANQTFPDQAIVDLTDLADSLSLDGKNIFFIKGYLMTSRLGPNKPTIKGLRITDSTRGIDVYLACNTVVQDSIFYVEWTFDKTTITDIAVSPVPGPARYELVQNYPNPFNPATTINFSVLKASIVTIKVYDILGKEVAALVNEEKQAGNYKVEFNASKLASGVYIYRMTAVDPSLRSGQGFVETKKLILLK